MERSSLARTPSAVFGRRIAETRKDRGWSQQRLADEVGVNRTDVLKLENGKRAHVTLEEVFDYAAALGVPPVDVMVPLDDKEGIEIAGKVRSAGRARQWVVGLGSLRGAPSPKRYVFRQMPRTRVRALVSIVLAPPPEKRLAATLAGGAQQHERLVDEAVDLLRNLPIEEEENDG